MSSRAERSVLSDPAMPHLLLVVFCCFAGFALLVPVSPVWALRGGADEFGSGLVTAVLMAATVLSQLCVRGVLRRIGWTWTLALGALLLGLPAPLQALSDQLPAVLGTTALRGLGFGILTVCGSTAVSVLAPRGKQGAAIGLYGLAIAVPQVLLTPAAPWLVSAIGLPAVLACGALPVLALPWTRGLGRAVAARVDETARSGEPDEPAGAVLRRIALPLVLLLLVTSSGGAVLTFAPQFTPTPALATAALLATTATAAVARWVCGVLVDRYPPRPINVALLLSGSAGLLLTASAVGPAPGTAALLAGMLLLGVAYGGLQSVTLVQAFDRAGTANRHVTSVAWNIGFDSGTGLGSLLIGVAAGAATFATGFAGFSAALALAAVAALVLGGRAVRPSPETVDASRRAPGSDEARDSDLQR